MAASARRLLPWAVVLTIALGPATTMAPADDGATTAPGTASATGTQVQIAPKALIDPTAGAVDPVAPTGDPDPAAPSDAPGTGTDPAPGADPGAGSQTKPSRNGSAKPAPTRGNAALQPDDAKRAEAKASCTSKRPPPSHLLAIGSSVVSKDGGGSWTSAAIVIALAAAALAALGFGVRRGHAAVKGQPSAPRSMLERVATIVAIGAGVAGLAVQFVPGVGAHVDPPPEATMQVRAVNARITRGEYAGTIADKGQRQLSSLDRREVGNVVWLEMRLQGFHRDRHLALQWGSYALDLGRALVPGTAKETHIDLNTDSDIQKIFVPVWVGYPPDKRRFEVQFRLLDGRQVRDLARTGPMKGPKYRYACGQPV